MVSIDLGRWLGGTRGLIGVLEKMLPVDQLGRGLFTIKEKRMQVRVRIFYFVGGCPCLRSFASMGVLPARITEEYIFRVATKLRRWWFRFLTLS